VRHSLLLALSLATLELKLDAFIRALERHYRPDQPRVPAGNPDGGQWTDAGAGQVERRIRTALSAVLATQRVGLGEDRMIRHCWYQDMLGRQFTREIDASETCPPTIPAPRYWGPL
jgi:hypothetical protein